jgi:hypothetical protein
MVAAIVPRITGNDGKSYPLFRLSSTELEILIDCCHHLRHVSQMSIAQIQEWLADHGVPRSRGAVHKYLTEWRCENCSGRPTVSRQTLAAS